MAKQKQMKVKATSKASAGTRKDEMDYGPRKVGRVGSSVSDGAGSRSRAGLPPKTVALAEKAELPKGAKEMASPVLPVPGVDDKIIGSVESWDVARDRKLGNTRKGEGQ